MASLTSRATAKQLHAILDMSMSGARRQVPSELLKNPAGLRARLVQFVGDHSGEDPLSAVCNQSLGKDLLIDIKDRARALVRDAQEEETQVAATLLYHAAIAAALVTYGTNISSRPLASRISVYEDLADVLAGDDLAHLFRAAADRIFLKEVSGKSGESA